MLSACNWSADSNDRHHHNADCVYIFRIGSCKSYWWKKGVREYNRYKYDKWHDVHASLSMLIGAAATVAEYRANHNYFSHLRRQKENRLPKKA